MPATPYIISNKNKNYKLSLRSINILIKSNHILFAKVDGRANKVTLWRYTKSEILIGYVNSSPSGQNGCNFANDIFRCIFLNEKFCVLIKVSRKFILNGPIDNNPTLVQIMAWRQIGDKPLFEPMLTLFTDTWRIHASPGGDDLTALTQF